MSSEVLEHSLASLCLLVADCPHATPEWTASGVVVLRNQNIKGGRLDLSAPSFTDEAHYLGRIRRAAPQEGDLVITREAPMGEVCQIPAGLKCCLGQRQVLLRPDPEKVDSRFLLYALQSPYLQHQIGWNEGTGSTVSNLRIPVLEALKVPTPSVATQREVASVLGALDDRITLLRETNATLEAIAQALFKSWFVDFDPVRAKAEGRQPEGMDAATAALFPDSFEESELGLVPKGWGVVPFLDACDLQGGAQPPAATFIDEPRDGYVRLLQIRDFSTDAHKTYIPDTGKLKKVTEDDVLIGRYGSASGDKAKDSLGRVCRGLSGSYNVALMKLCPVQVGREYALQLVSDSSFYGYLQGVSSKAVQSGFSKAELGQYKVIMPPSDLAEAFEQFGKAVWERVKANRELAQTLTQLRDTLLPRLISGQLRLPEAESLLENAL